MLFVNKDSMNAVINHENIYLNDNIYKVVNTNFLANTDNFKLVIATLLPVYIENESAKLTGQYAQFTWLADDKDLDKDKIIDILKRTANV